MKEIKVGEYVRTKDGYIAKLKKYSEEIGSYFFDSIIQKMIDGDTWKVISENALRKEIVKHSPNIIDLIEEDDIGIMRYNGLIFKKFITKDDILELKFKNYELLEIVTKEMFNQVKYEV